MPRNANEQLSLLTKPETTVVNFQKARLVELWCAAAAADERLGRGRAGALAGFVLQDSSPWPAAGLGAGRAGAHQPPGAKRPA